MTNSKLPNTKVNVEGQVNVSIKVWLITLCVFTDIFYGQHNNS